MAIGGENSLLFRIKADGDQAKRELNSVKGEIGGLGGAMNALGGPAGIATAALAAIGTVAVAAAAGIFRLTVAAAEYGSAIFDASEKTGLGAETLSALKYAADTSGSSLEAITGSIAKFNVLIGEANQGNEKANKTLEQYGITARTTDEALAQAIKTVAQMTDTDQQAAAAKALFKDRTAEILPVIKSFSGDLPGLIAKLRELGLVMSDEDARAADAFGDTLDTLKMQAAATGRAFATGLMPDVTDAMSAISGAMGSNKELAQAWGAEVGSTVRGVGEAYLWLESAGKGALAGLDYALGTNLANTGSWANAVISSLGAVGAAWYALNRLGDAAKRAQAQQEADAWGNVAVAIGDQYVNAPVNTMPGFRPPGGGGGGRGGGGGGRGGGSAARDTEFEDAEKRQMRILEEYKSGLDGQKALLDLHLAAKLISEREYAEEVGKLKIRELKEEKLTYETIQQFAKITAAKKEELEHKIGLIRGELHTQELKNSKDVLEIDLDRIEKELEAEEKLDAERKKLHEAEMERARKLRAERLKKEGQSAIDEDRREQARLLAQRQAIQGMGTGGTDQFGALIDKFGDNQAAIAGVEALRSVFEGLAQAIGQAVQAWVLYGNIGGSARKVSAQIIAALAQQAAVKAIFETAEGLAALARFWLFGDAKALGEAKLHFASAATYAVVAGAAAVAGRGIAGNSFNEATGGGGAGGGGGGNSSDRDPNAFGERFRGFGDQNNPFTRAADRMIQAIMLQEEATTRFMHQFGTASPGDVVMRVAESDPEIFGRANEKYLDESGGRGTERLMRRTGMAT